MEELGISYTERTLASRLASLGLIAALDGPLLVGDFIALLTGVTILTVAIADKLSRNKSAVVDDIKFNEGYSFSQEASYSIGLSATVVSNIKN